MAVIAASLEELALVIGAQAARAFMTAFAGRRIYVPQAIGPDHPIAAAIGADKAAVLADYYGGTHLEPPLAAAKRWRVLEMAAAGVPDSEIAKALWTTERHVRRIRAAAQAAAAQLRLPV
ncbi:helix-turn-helix domain-containing protein [Thermaurantiacus tibetensis]|uniref:helix-turn-helix domain-containing protein n=1 Tax=Thermaurantiacus tibetensis TaxID=2759035 RepID=UPI00188FB085|nr:helix-turn-helix domain-containing protein [Thermaurantiacus tibetensis]